MYRRGAIASDSLESLAASLRNELDRLALALAQPVEYLSLTTIYAEPDRVFEGQVVKADGTTWNPGGTGAGLYARIGGAWVKL